MEGGQEQFNLDMQVKPDEAEKTYIDRIRRRIEELQASDLNLLFSYLYRLDIEEGRLKELIRRSFAGNFAEELAEEIWQRQKQRLQHKKDTPVRPITDKDWEL